MKTRKWSALGFVLIAGVLLGAGWFSYQSIGRIARNEAWVIHTHEVLDVLRDSLASLADLETSQRGYLLTGDRAHLELFDQSLGTIHREVERLGKLVADNPVQEERLPPLRSTIDSRLNRLRAGIAERDRGGLEAGVAVVATGKGKEEMDFIRATIGAMVQAERELLTVREAQSKESYRATALTLWVSLLIGLVVVSAAYALTLREAETRRRGLEALAKANDELETRVAERTEDLQETNLSLQRSNRELEQFASVASHDLQEPLRKIQAFGDRLATRFKGQLGEQGDDYLKRMLASAFRMRSLIDALLSFSRVTTKAQPFTTVDLNQLLQDVLSDLEEQVKRTGGKVQADKLPAIEADPLQMRQLLQNLIGNALKFSKPDVPPSVRISQQPAVINEKEAIEIRVSDNGIGFEEVYLDRIFELFQRLHGRQEYEGTGMGLAICRKIVERHGGTITAKSAPNEGATFVLTLPLTQERSE